MSTTKRFDATKEQSVADWSDSLAKGSGNDNHAPIGLKSGITFRELIKFSYDWTGVAKIVSARLYVKSTGQVHLAFGADPRLSIRRLSSGFSRGGGAENSWSPSADEVWPGPGVTGATESSSASDINTSENTWYDFDITDVLCEHAPASVLDPNGDPCGGNTNYGFRIYATDEGNTSHRFEFYSMRASGAPYIILTYLTNTAPETPTGLSPSGTKTDTPDFSAISTDADNDALTTWDIQVTTDPTFASITHWDGSGAWGSLTAGLPEATDNYLLGKTYAPDGTIGSGGLALTRGATYYYRVRAHDDITTSDWATGSFTVNQLPTVGTFSPGASGFAYIHNLDDLAVWTSGGTHAKPRFSFVYSDADSHAMNAYEIEATQNNSPTYTTLWSSGTTALSATAGSTCNIDCPNAVVDGTEYRWRVRVRDSKNEWSDWSSWMAFKVRWGQAIYAEDTGGTGTSGWRVSLGTVSGTGAQLATIFQGADDAAGTGGTSWSDDISDGQGKQFCRILVRLAATVTGQNPTLDDLTMTYLTAAAAPDKWTSSGSGSHAIDFSARRFGEKSVKMTVTAASTYTLYPYRSSVGDGIGVTPNTPYTYSAYVKVPTSLGTGKVRLRVYDIAGTTLLSSFDSQAETSDTSGEVDGWARLTGLITIPSGVSAVRPVVELVAGSGALSAWVDGTKFEVGTVATSWTAGSTGKPAIVDYAGVSIDALNGGVFRLRGSSSTATDRTVSLGDLGLQFDSPMTLKEISTPDAAASGYGRFYLKSDGQLYIRRTGSESVIGGASDHGTLTGLADDDHTQYQLRSEKGANSGYAGLDSGGLVDPSDLGSGDADQWTGLTGLQTYDLRWRVWAPTSGVSASSTSAVDSGFSFTYTASDTSVAFDMFIMHNRQASGGGLRLRWENTTGNTGGNVRGILEMGQTSASSWLDGGAESTSAYGTWYGGYVPSTNNSVRYGRWKGRMTLPTSGTFPGTIKLQISSVASAECVLVQGSWLQYTKF